MEHIKDSATLSYIGYKNDYIPRENLGKYLINLENNQTVLMSADKVLVVSPKSFMPLKFGFQKIQEPYGYVLSDGKKLGATVYAPKVSEWNDFYLVTKYLTTEGIIEDKKHIKIK